MSALRTTVCVCLLAALPACDRSQPSAPQSSRLGDLVIAGGNNQSASPGQPVSQPLAVKAVDQEGRPLSGVRVTFRVASGGGALSDSAATTGPDGLAQTRLTLGFSPGANTVTAQADGLSGLPPTFTATALGSTSLTDTTGGKTPVVSGGPPDPAHFTVTAERQNLPGGVTAGMKDRITAYAFDAQSNPVPQGTTIQFTTTLGGIEAMAQTDGQGKASVDLITTGTPGKGGFAEVTARATGRNNVPVSGKVRVLFSGTTRLALQPAVLGADTLQSFTISVGDSSGNPLSQATQVRVTAQNGSLQGDTEARLPDTQERGPGRTDFAFTLQRSTGTRAQLTVTVVSPNGDAQVVLVGGVGAAPGGTGGPTGSTPARLALSLSDSALLADGLSTSRVTATLTALDGTPIRGTAVEFLSNAGLIEPSGVTNAAGQAGVILTSAASAADLRTTVRAFAAGLRDSASVRMVGLTLSLSASPDTIAADGNAQSRVVASLTETVRGTPVPFARVVFGTTAGTLSAPSALTERDGRATAILTSPAVSGRATVTASYGAGLTARRQVAFVKGPPASIVLVSVEPASIGVRGAGSNATAFITFEVRDAQGTPVADGEQIAFSLDPAAGGETINPSESATVNGRVRVAFNSGTVARTVRVIARWSAGAVASTPVPVAVHGGLPDLTHFSLGANPVNLAGRVVLGLKSTITAYVFDKYSNPVPAGTSVRFRTDGGGIQGAAETNADGQGGVSLFTASPIPSGPEFLATITGQTVNENGQPIEASTTVLFSGATVVQLTGVGADTVLAGRVFIRDGGGQIVQFSVSDVDDKPIMGGSTIKVTSDVGRISGDSDVIIPDVRSGSTRFAIAVSDPTPREDPPLPPQGGAVLIRVQSTNGNRLLAFAITVD